MIETIHDAYALALGKEVAIGSVDKELRLLWEEDKASTNASLINLAVYSEGQDTIIKNSKVVQSITREHACRALLIGIDRENPEASIRAWITAHCHFSHGRKSICCEQIAFQLTGQATGRLRNTVFAHLNSDLPLVFWWQGELSPIFSERLYSLIDRFIFDSSQWADPLSSYLSIKQVMADSEELLPVDLEWTRSLRIRLAIAGLFDDLLAIRSLDHISEIKICVHPANRMAGLQLLAWLIHCMKWSISEVPSGEGDPFYFKTEDGVGVTATLSINATGPAIGLVELSSPECCVKVTRDAGSPYLHQQLDAGKHQINRCTPAANDEPAELVMSQLSRGGKNSLYRKILPGFLELLGGVPE